ncbi:MAG: YibE/F family protein [Patescibacteria group bacterium]
MKKNKSIKYIFASLFVFMASFLFCSAETVAEVNEDVVFKARVVEILEEKEKVLDDGSSLVQQNLKLLGLEGDYKNKDVFFYGIGDLEIIANKQYSKGDKLLMVASFDNIENDYKYYVLDYSRSSNLLFMFLFFLLVLFVVGRWKGLRAIVSLFFTFLAIIFYIVPQILNGANPIIATMLACIFIIFFIIYITEGFNIRSNIAFVSTLVSLLLVVGISSLFVFWGGLTGAFNEDVFILLSIGDGFVNFKGLLLAGIIIGALGVIDDIIISQIVTVEQIVEANPHQRWKEVFKKANKVGVSHISSMTNTLFLAYAGASLPLLILFVSPDNPFSSFEQIISNEAISTEIIRALSGSIGIVLSVPLSTFLASWWFTYKKNI